MQLHWTGVYPAVLTAFNADDSLDLKLFEINTLAQIDAGVDGIVLAGSLGEASTLLQNEKNILLQEAKAIAGSKIAVIMNIAEQSTKAALAAAADAERLGADGLMLLPPLRYFADDDETLEFFSKVAANTSLPIMIYNNPIDYKIKVTLKMFDALSAFANIQAVKESTRDVSNIIRMHNAFGDRFKVLTGVDPLALESLCIGAAGWVAGLGDAFPRETVAIYRMIKAGQVAPALEIYKWFLPLLELDLHPKLVQYIKLAASMTSLGSENVRAPRLPISGKEREQILHIIEKALATRPALPDYLAL